MKKSLRYLLSALLAVVATVFAGAALAACDATGGLTGIKVENAKIMFRVGDEFECGEDFTVYALYANGTKEDVTELAELKKSNGFDMNVAGDYDITVSYNGKKDVYTIYVDEFDPILRKLELDTSEMKKTFTLGDDVAFDGLKLNLTYENAQGVQITSETTSLKGFGVDVRNSAGAKVEGVFDDFGEYTVTISQGSVNTSFTVEVNDVDISTVQGALYAGNAFKYKVVSGTQVSSGAISTKPLTVSFDYEYTFGDNYTYFHERRENPDTEYHLSMVDDEIFCVRLQGGNIVTNGSIQSSMMQGPPNMLWYYMSTYYGVESAITLLHQRAKVCTNEDLVETVDEAKREYSFTFSGLEIISDTYHFFETTVRFTLGEEYNIKSVEYTQKFYENNEAMKGEAGYTPTFITDENGKTVPNKLTYTTNVVVEQTAGERTAVNPYTADMFRFSSIDMVYNNQTLEDNAVIKCNAGDKINVILKNYQPALATFDQDPLLINYEGNYGGFVDSKTILNCEGFIVFRSNNVINDYLNVTILNGGKWTLYLKTANLNKSITFDVTGKAPTSMTSQLLNEASGAFYSGNTKNVSINGSVYFYGLVNKYANSAQSASVSSPNATVEKVTKNGVDCFKFSATAAGTYTVTVTSDVGSVSCKFTFKVSEAPDYASILDGKYTATDYEGNIYEVEVTPASATDDNVSGTVKVTMTPTEEDDTPVTGSAQSQTLSYSVDFDSLTINLTAVSGTNLGVGFEVNAGGNFVLKDKYNDSFVLTRE